MTGVRVVEPVVIIRDVVRTALALHAEHVTLAGIPEAVVAHCHILRIRLYINSAIALGMVA